MNGAGEDTQGDMSPLGEDAAGEGQPDYLKPQEGASTFIESTCRSALPILDFDKDGALAGKGDEIVNLCLNRENLDFDGLQVRINQLISGVLGSKMAFMAFPELENGRIALSVLGEKILGSKVTLDPERSKLQEATRSQLTFTDITKEESELIYQYSNVSVRSFLGVPVTLTGEAGDQMMVVGVVNRPLAFTSSDLSEIGLARHTISEKETSQKRDEKLVRDLIAILSSTITEGVSSLREKERGTKLDRVLSTARLFVEARPASLEEFLDRSMRKIRDAFAAERAVFFHWAHGSKFCLAIFFDKFGGGEAKQSARVPINHGLIGRVLTTRKLFNFNNSSLQGSALPETKNGPTSEIRPKCLLIFPLEWNKVLHGAVEVCNKQPDGPFDLEDEKLAKEYAHYLSMILKSY